MAGAGGVAIGAAEFLDELAQGHWRRADRDSLYRHVFGVERVDSDGTVHAVEGWPGGARRAVYRLEDSSILWSSSRVELTNVQREVIVVWLVAHLGAKYSWLDFAAQGALNLHVPLAGRWLEHRVEKSGRYLCSAYQMAAWHAAGVELWSPARWCGAVAPSDIADVLTT
jgi:uncharacterized protein YycO